MGLTALKATPCRQRAGGGSKRVTERTWSALACMHAREQAGVCWAALLDG